MQLIRSSLADYDPAGGFLFFHPFLVGTQTGTELFTATFRVELSASKDLRFNVTGSDAVEVVKTTRVQNKGVITPSIVERLSWSWQHVWMLHEILELGWSAANKLIVPMQRGVVDSERRSVVIK